MAQTEACARRSSYMTGTDTTHDQATSDHGKRNDSRVVDIGRLVSSMKRELDYYWSLDEELDTRARTCLIYKVQQHIREMDRTCYEPIMLSIGPYHHGAAACQIMENSKWGYLDEVLKLSCGINLLDYLNAIQALSSMARRCYSDHIEMGNEDFLQMLLLDGCWILVALGATEGLSARIQLSGNSRNGKDRAVDTAEDELQKQYVNDEVTVAENADSSQESNQTREMEDAQPSQQGKDIAAQPFPDAIAGYVESTLRCYPVAVKDCNKPRDYHHLLHLCHMFFRPTQKPLEEHHYEVAPQYLHRFLSFGRRYLKLGQDHHYHDRNGSSTQQVEYVEAGQQLNRWRRVAQYLEAGVRFRKREFDPLEPHSLLDIRFSHGALELPCLVIDEHTEFLFRNLIAFEQTCPQFGDDFTAYAVFMSQLISMPEDVTLLAKKRIIVHHLDSDERVSDLFTMLSKDVVFDFNGNYYLKSLCQTMEAYYQNRLNRWMAWLWFNHFSNPWLGLAALATVIVLVCTIVQTVFSILAYIHPPDTPNS